MPLISSGVVKGRRCPICGAEHSSCGLPYQGTPTDIPEVSTVADDRTLYIYTDNEGHTFQMTEADGEAAGYTRAAPVDQRPAEATDEDAEVKARAQAANKARTASENK